MCVPTRRGFDHLFCRVRALKSGRAPQGWITPLFDAAAGGEAAVAQVLLEAGADKEAKVEVSGCSGVAGDVGGTRFYFFLCWGCNIMSGR